MESSSGNVDPTEAKSADELRGQCCLDIVDALTFAENSWHDDLMFIAPSDQHVSSNSTRLSDHVGQNEQNPQNHDGKSKSKRINISSEKIREAMSRNLALTDAAREFEVSRSTLKRRLKELGFTYWPSSRKFKSLVAKKRKDDTKFQVTDLCHDLANPANPTDPTLAGNEAVTHNEYLKEKTTPFLPLSDSFFNCGITVMGTESLHYQEHMDGPSSTSLNTAEPEDCDDTFIVKANYKGDVVKFEFSLSSSIDQLMEEVSKRLELEKGNFKFKYMDEDNDWILISSSSDLERAVRMSRSLGSNVVRLLVTAKS